VLRRVVKRVRSGRFQLRLSADERDVLRSLPEQLKEMLTEDDPALRRLFPPAYLDDPKAENEYHRLMREDLLEHHRAALDVMAATIDADELDEDQLTSWMGAINDLRLVLGTKLDVSEDEVQLETPADHLYHYLGYLMEEIVVALSSRYE
jgi:hypothetical protein